MSHHDDRTPIAVDPAMIYARLDELRTALRWSWGDLEASCGIGQRTALRWRDGEALPLIGAVRTAAEALGVTYDEITYGLTLCAPKGAPQSEPPGSRRTG